MASSAAKLLRATAASQRTALTSAAAQELATLTQRRVVPVDEPITAGARTIAPATAMPAAVPPAAGPTTPPTSAAPASATSSPTAPAARPQPGRPQPPQHLGPAGRNRPGAGRTRSPRRWQLTGVVLAIVLVAAVLLTMAIRRGPAPGTGRTTQNAGSRQITAESAVRNAAAVWIAGQVGHDIEIACDAATCSDLAQDGFPAGNLNTLQPSAPDPYGSELVVATAGVRSQFGSKLAAVYAPEVIASFGTGASRIDIRVVAPAGPAAFHRALSADLLAGKSSGTELLRNPKIVVSATASTQLAAGEVDLRLLTTLAFMAGQEPIDIVNFGSIEPGASPGVPLRFADLAETDPAARMTAPAYLHALLALVHAQEPPYVPLTVGSVRLSSGQTVLRIDFAAPSLLGLLPP